MPPVDCEQSIEQLFTSIGKYQAEFEKLKDSKNGDRLKFVGRLSVTDGKVECSVKPEWVDQDSEMYRMRGTEIYLAIATESSQRVLLQGAGQGGINGAVGVVRDILGIATRLHKNSTMY